ncbi:Disease resistance protein RGA2 [Vitis vinifera]|uniref:Disease resistance protein RGA2 n=1 Tax=Vitis vinifera TaxID=29760 RepID=A0A438FXD8_VITVI|nr:Disease resistance protein RGA2 [Vitis vinifera]
MAYQIPFGVVEHILTNLGSSAFQEIGSMYGVPKEITKLNGKLGTIKAVLLDAQEKQQQQSNRAVKDWVRRLRGVVYDADDLLDDYATHYLQRGGLARQVSDFFSSENQVAFRFKMSHRLEDIKERLDDVANDIPMLNLIPRDIVLHTGEENSWRETHSFSLPSEIVGREENKEEIIRKLSSNNEEILSVVAIVGFGGLGKTTLTQLVYNDERVKHFEHKTWVCISDDSGDGLDVKLWVKKILKSMGVQGVESMTLDGLKDKLHEKISQKKYLLVLDDVWNENPRKWYEVKKLLMVGAKGSKIIVTTRKLNVASIMEDKSPVSLKGLGEKESWDLFSKFAFREQEILKPEIVEIGEEIAKMCKGVPLVIKSLAMILQSKRELGQWLSIRNNKNLLSLGDENENVLGVLKLSYDNLSTHLRQCFTYCALFPKDYEIEKKLVVQLWIAQGYIQSSNDNNEQLEDIGDRYFEELLSRSLLEKAGSNHLTNTLRLKNLQTLKLKVCPNLKKLPKNIRQLINLRHLENERWSDLTHMPRGIGKLTLLQSLPLFVVGNETGRLRNHKIGSLIELESLNHLRGGLCISNLQNVRDVELVSRGEILKGKQYLQSLRLEWNRSGQDGGDEGDKSVMEGLQPHPQLKDIFIEGYGGTEFPSWMMNDRRVHCNATFPSLESLELSDMPKLKELWRMDLLAEEGPSFAHLSKLHIHKCSGLASLHSSPSLSQLEIRNCHNLASLELPPSHCLSKLKIVKCPNLASFNVASLPRLEELSLRGVRAEVLRQLMFVSASSSLKSLHIRKIDGMISIPEEPLQCVSTLETLYIVECSGLATLLHWMGSLSSLTKLIIYYCSELTSLPEEIYSLKKLQTFYFCDYPHLEERYKKETGEDRAKIAHIPHVRFNSDSYMELEFEEILRSGMITLNLKRCFVFGILLHLIDTLTSLTELGIHGCPELTSLPEDMFPQKPADT